MSFRSLAIACWACNAPVGKLANINAILIIFLVPTIGALTQRFAAYRMVVIGGAICAAGVFIMALPPVWFVPLANGPFGQWLGHSYLGLEGSINPYYVMTALYLMVFSVGEAFYSPRVYEYAAAIAPTGQEASYGALAYLPFLIGKLLVGYSRLDPGGFLSRGRAAPSRHDVAYLRARGFGCAHWVAAFQPLHPRAGSRPIGSRLGNRPRARARCSRNKEGVTSSYITMNEPSHFLYRSALRRKGNRSPSGSALRSWR